MSGDLAPFFAVYGGLAVLAPLAAVFERRAPATSAERMPRTRRGLVQDLAYWVITPLFTGSLARAFTLGVVGAIGFASGFGTDGDAFVAHMGAHTLLAGLPVLVTFPLAVVVADLLGYVSHRLRHAAALWPLHAVHHATRELTALAAARLHPLDELVDSALIGVPLILLGVPVGVYAALGPFFVLHTLLVHANVPWSFGRLGRVFASPRFHRRHHAQGLPGANYGGVFAFYDVLFGTFDLPAADPAPFGLGDGEPGVPGSLAGQMLYPFTRTRARAGAWLVRR